MKAFIITNNKKIIINYIYFCNNNCIKENIKKEIFILYKLTICLQNKTKQNKTKQNKTKQNMKSLYFFIQ